MTIVAPPPPPLAAPPAIVPLAPGVTPTVAVIAKDQPSNGVIRIRLRANADPASDSYATFTVQDGTHTDPTTGAVIPATTAADIQAWVAQEKARMVREYSAMALAHSALLAEIQ